MNMTPKHDRRNDPIHGKTVKAAIAEIKAKIQLADKPLPKSLVSANAGYILGLKEALEILKEVE